MRRLSSTFDRACNQPPEKAPHLLPPRRGHFLDKVVDQFVQHNTQRRRDEWTQELERYEWTVTRPWVRELLFDDTQAAANVRANVKEGIVVWFLARLKAKAGVSSPPPPPTDIAALYSSPAPLGERTRHVLQQAVLADRHGQVSDLRAQARKLSLILQKLLEPGLGRLVLQWKLGCSVSWDPFSETTSSTFMGESIIQLAEKVLLSTQQKQESGPSYNYDDDAMILAALPSLDESFSFPSGGIMYDAHTRTLSCPCGRSGLRSLLALRSHVHGSGYHHHRLRNLHITTSVQ